ncbi:hypothetical protein [Herbiconiux ginsengi]|uniref:Uncharacterized protein n=1 Tax=Herbiconiux ginsengi TaxID=381665 RepID=A0A1H3L7K4_9MICO|nr:hypothetical protein [Herbiconiux ginsengi]SDY59904.1 hypothetical protein SAMN05216554_0847 [Herbiconiux ginsengi]
MDVDLPALVLHTPHTQIRLHTIADDDLSRLRDLILDLRADPTTERSEAMRLEWLGPMVTRELARRHHR